MDLLRFDSWSNDGSRTPIGRRWWKQKRKKQRQMTLTQVVLFFAVVLILVMILIGFGGSFLVKRWRAIKFRLDSQLTTKTALCRAQYNDRPPDCVTEDVDLHGECGSTSACIAMKWTFTHDPDTATSNPEHHVFGAAYEYDLDTTDFAECAEDIVHRQWCQEGNCEPSRIKPENWWPSIGFPNKNGKMIARAINDLPCLHVPEESKTAYANMVSSYVGSCGLSVCQKHCNNSGCSSGGGGLVKYGLRVELRHCDTKMDPVTGVRGAHCSDPPMALIACHECGKFDESQSVKKKDEFANTACEKPTNVGVGCSFSCPGDKAPRFVPDGSTCQEQRKPTALDGICFMGVCYSHYNQTVMKAAGRVMQ